MVLLFFLFQGIENQISTKVEKGDGPDEVSYRIEVNNLLADKKCNCADGHACKVGPYIFTLDDSRKAGDYQNKSPPAVEKEVNLCDTESVDT